LVTGLLTGGLDGLPEDVRCGSLRAVDDVGVHAKGDGRVRVAEPGRDDVSRDAGQQQGCRVQVPQVV
jgi:hypothetical protein